MSSKPKPTAVHVVAAALIDADERVLIAQRPPGKHLAGGWEFPGGKLEPGEDRRTGLQRELREELGVEIAALRPLMRLKHAYPYGEVLLDMWVVRQYSGVAAGLDGQALRWCSLDELSSVDMLPADAPLVAALRLPERLIHVSTNDYTVIGLGRRALTGRLRGVVCANMADAVAASHADANFLALQSGLSRSEITTICERVPIPIYVPSLELKEAWDSGASGIHELKIA